MIDKIVATFLHPLRLLIAVPVAIAAAIWLKLTHTGGPYAILAIILGPMIVLEALGLRGDPS